MEKTVTLNADSFLIGFATAKKALRDLQPSAWPASMYPSLRLMFPLDQDIAKKARASASLTDSATPKEQIRYFGKERARRSIIRIGDYVAANGKISLTISRAADLDEASRFFFQIVSEVSGWHVSLDYSESSSARNTDLDEDDRATLSRLERASDEGGLITILDCADEYINAGDAWTGVNLATSAIRLSPSTRAWNLLAIGEAMLERTLSAEYYYSRWAHDGSPLDKARALYGMSMLYARHHPAELRDIRKAADLLQVAYREIQGLGAIEREHDNTVFDEVFNRNGYALTLFRDGATEEALELLNWGIERLKETSEKVAIHRTVLMYNMAQCLTRLGRLDEAITKYQELLKLDAAMPEYHLELAQCLELVERLPEARREVELALKLDDTLAPGWTLLGTYASAQENWPVAIGAFEAAARLRPRDVGAKVDLGYSLVAAGEYTRAQLVLSSLLGENLNQEDGERAFSLLAEIQVRMGEPQCAESIIEDAMIRWPNSQALVSNSVALASLVSAAKI